MIIRHHQLQSLEQVRSPEFDDCIVDHLKQFSPLHSKSLGEAGVRTLISTGIERAKTHGFTHRGPVKFYIESMILLGVDFDTDPQYPRVGAILRNPSVPDQTERADLAHAWLMELLEVAGGPDRRYAKEALHRARKIPFEPLSLSSPTFVEEMIAKMAENHPEKVRYVGEKALGGLVPRAVEETHKYSVATDAGVCLFAGLMFSVGHGFVNDPKYPWIANTLKNRAISDPDKRVEKLYSKTMTYLDHVLLHLREQ